MEVSVICPVFNTHPDLIAAAVRSVMNQMGSHRLELILVDDASTSLETHAALRSAAAADSRVHAVFQPVNGGPGKARTAGIKKSIYNWIGFIDADDLWPPGKLCCSEAIVQERLDARWISGRFTTMLPGQQLRDSRLLTHLGLVQEAGRLAYRLASPGLTRVLIGDWQPLGASLVRKDLLVEAGGFDDRLIYGEDWLLYLRLSTFAPMEYSETSTYLLRRQGLSMMRSPARMSGQLVHSVQLARRDPTLRAVRKELRWFHYSTCKDIAMNSALNGRKIQGLLFALRALAIDPREFKDFLLFLTQLSSRGLSLAKGLREYSTAEQVVLANLGPQHGDLPPAA